MRLYTYIMFVFLCTACASSNINNSSSTAKNVEYQSMEFTDVRVKAEQGESLAVLELARRYADGDQVRQDALVALDLYGIFAESDSDLANIAQTRIGKLYMEGVPPLKQDFVEAYIWFDKVITGQGREVIVDRERVLRLHNFARLNMSDAERVELQQRLDNKTY